MTECASPKPGSPPVTKIRATARDRVLRAGFACEATIAAGAPASESKIVEIHRICSSLEGMAPLEGCAGLPASLTWPEANGGFVAGSHLAPGWFRREVRWGADRHAISQREAVRRANQVGLATELTQGLSQPLACEFHPGGTLRFQGNACAVDFELDLDSRTGPIWTIAAVSCSRTDE